MGKGSGAPAPPDPQQTIAAQQAANKEAIETGARYGQINQVTPWGQVSFTGELGSPERTQTVSLSPGQQQAFEGQQALQNALVGFANQQIPQVTETLGKPLSFEGLQEIPGQTDATRARTEQAVYQRGLNLMNPGFENEQRNAEVNLANRGIARGSEAWNEEMRAIAQRQGQAKENLGLSAVQAGGTEASRLLTDALRGRQQGIQETTTLRGQPINELAAILGQTAGVNQPSFQGVNQGPILQTNAGNIINQSYQNELANAKLAADRDQALMSGITQMGSAAMMGFMSSRALKTNGRPVSEILPRIKELPVEAWDYIEDGSTHIGPYAEDFQAMFGVGDGRGIHVADAFGVCLLGIQELLDRVEALEK